MTVTLAPPRNPRTDLLTPDTDKPTRGPVEHPNRIPQERAAHPVTARKSSGSARRTEKRC